ncbi:MAG: glycosyltransferase [Alphaproteobacteria bacterium]|nr:glycosyltransferase [Alphaproteobacteria bacterium]
MPWIGVGRAGQIFYTKAGHFNSRLPARAVSPHPHGPLPHVGLVSVSMSASDSTSTRIAIFIEDLSGGGAEKVTVLLAGDLAARGYATDLIVQRATGPFVDQVSPRVNFIEIGGKNPLQSVLWLMHYLRRARPAAMITEMEKASLLGIVAGRMVGYHNIFPCVHIDLASYDKIDHQMRRRFLKVLVSVFYRASKGIIACAERPAASMRALLGRAAPPVSMIQNGFDLAAFRAEGAEPTDHRWLTAKDRPVFVACGRLTQQKGYDVMLRAFARLRREQPARLIILGQGPLREELGRQASKLGIGDDVDFAGFLKNPLALFTKADGYLMSSRSEGLPSVLIMALAAGCKSISTDCPAGPSEILDGGKFGRLVPVDDDVALAAAMADLLAGRNEPAGSAQEREAHMQQYSIENMVRDYIKVIGV